MSRAGGDPLAADELPELPAEQLMVFEAPPDPPAGSVRDAMADAGSARVDRAVALMDTAITGYNERLESVVEARMRGPRARKGTRFWNQSPIGVKVGGDPVFIRGVDGSSAHKTLVGVELKALDASYVLPERTVDELADVVRPVCLRIVADATSNVAKSLKRPNTGLAAFDWADINATVDDAVKRLLEVNERHARDIRGEILRADSSADSLDQAIDRVTEATRRGGRWLLLAGRTLATALTGDAALAAARALGVTHTQWLCVAGDTEVWASGVLNVARRWSTEGLLRITTDQGSSRGGELAVTPDHPLLTQRGWVAARELHPGDHLVRGSFIERNAGSDPDEQREPAQIGEFFAAANERVPAERVMRASPDFDGDGCGSHVDVVPVNGELADRVQPTVGEPRAHHLLTLTDLDLESLLHDCSGDYVGVGLDSADVEGCQMGVAAGGYLRQLAGDPIESGGRLVSPRDVASFDDATDHLLGSGEASCDRTRSLPVLVGSDDRFLVQHPVAPAEGLRGSSLGESFRSVQEPTTDGVLLGEQDARRAQATSDGFGTAVHSGGDLAGGLSGLVATDKIIGIEVDSTACHVYDLQTVTGWFMANGYVIHNSRRDDRVRHTHVEADGQIRPVGTKFRVGDFGLRFPADPEVLPEGAREVYGCRCSLLFAPPSGQRGKAIELVAHGTPQAARRLSAYDATPGGPLVLGSPELGAGLSIPQVRLPSNVVGYRTLSAESPVTPGQQISWPGPLTLALAPPVAAGVAVLAVALAAGTAVGVANGAVVLPSGVPLSVASVSSGQVVVSPVAA